MRVNIPPAQRNKPNLPASEMDGMEGQILGYMGKCAVFQPKGWKRKYEFIPVEWVIDCWEADGRTYGEDDRRSAEGAD